MKIALFFIVWRVNMIDINELLPRTQPDRYSHAILEQLIEINRKLDILVSPMTPEPFSDLSVTKVNVPDKSEVKPKRTRKKSE
jgi:aromatic ring-cleaving dioxygenase